MDKIIAVSLLILLTITAIEAISLFVRPRRIKKLSFAAVIPIFPKDSDLRNRIDALNRKLTDHSYYIEEIIFINYGATYEQLEICEQFCYENPNAVITDPASLEKILSKTFAIDHEI